MSGNTAIWLRHALEDLNEGVCEGVRALLGIDPPNPQLVRELLRGPAEYEPVHRDAGARAGLRPSKAPAPARRRSIGRSGGSSKIRATAGMR